MQVVEHLPEVVGATLASTDGVIRVSAQIEDTVSRALASGLRRLMPWRKGPLDIVGVPIDAEWRSDLKWNRLLSVLPELQDRLVLDVGCGNGYYLYRMAEHKPRLIVGIDPFVRYAAQFAAVQKYAACPGIQYLPIAFSELPPLEGSFDVVFCMGVLYHQRSPLLFLRELFNRLRPGGTLVLETITLPGAAPVALSPAKRYAKMHNCFFLPTESCLQNWLGRLPCEDIRWTAPTPTTTEEQRATEWMTFESLEDFLHSEDRTKTVEGHPAPQRSIVVCNKRAV